MAEDRKRFNAKTVQSSAKFEERKQRQSEISGVSYPSTHKEDRILVFNGTIRRRNDENGSLRRMRTNPDFTRSRDIDDRKTIVG